MNNKLTKEVSMTTDNLNHSIEPVTFAKKNMNASSASGNPADKKVAKTLKPLSMRPNRSVKKNDSMKQAYNKLK